MLILMRLALFSLMISANGLLLAQPASQPSVDPIAHLIEQGLSSNLAWDLVESLTTEVGPRLAGTDADARAVRWAQQKLSTLGFDRVWLEPVSFPVWLRHHEQVSIVHPYPQPLHVTALGYSGSTAGKIEAEVAAFDDLNGLIRSKPVPGKVVFINTSMQKTIDGSSYMDIVKIRYQTEAIAKEKGAVAVLIRSIGTDHNRLPHTGKTNRTDNPLPALALSAPDADQLARILKRGEVVRLAMDVSVSERPGGQSHNVIAQLDGSERPDEVILMGAHLDSWDLGTGAIDDAAGVGIVSAAAHLIAQMPQRPKRSIRVVLFANEEQGLWGAHAYVKQHAQTLSSIRYASESDFGAGKVWRLDIPSQSVGQQLAPYLKTLQIPVNIAAPQSGGPDIGPFTDKGVTAFRLLQDGRDYFDVHHTANDTLDKVSPEGLQHNVAAWAAVVYGLANE